MLMQNKKYLMSLAAAALLWSCTDYDSFTPAQPKPNPGEVVEVVDAASQTSQYQSREYDGQKRGDVFYEIYLRSFADGDGNGCGDLKGLTAKLDYLDELGVAGIWLMPPYLASSEHGYDVMDYMKVHPDYGTMEDMEQMIREAHKRKIRVILDFVPNHMSMHSDWFKQAILSVDNPYRSYFHFSDKEEGDRWYPVPKGGTEGYFYFGDFDKSMPDLNYGAANSCQNSAAFKALVKVAKFWIDKGVDGFRMDAVRHIYSNPDSDENPTWLRKFYDEVNGYFKGKSTLGFENLYMVGECWLGRDQIANYYHGIPGLFDFHTRDKINDVIRYSNANWFPREIVDTRNIYQAQRQGDFVQATFLSNHDQNRARTEFGGGYELSLARAKMGAAILLTSIGEPFMYYGEELGMMGDKNREQNFQVGDRNVRTPMLWTEKSRDTYRTSWINSTLNNDLSIGNVDSQKGEANSILNIYRMFLRLRNTYPALAKGSMTRPENFDEGQNKSVMVFYREADGERLLVLHNVSEQESTYEINHAIKAPIADMNHVTIQSEGDNQHKVTMPPYSSIIIEL